MMPGKVRVFIFYQNACIKGWEVGDQTLKGWVGRVTARGDAKVDRQILGWIGLVEGRSETFVEIGLDTLDGPDDRYMRDVGKWKCWCYGRPERFRIVALSR